MTQNTNTSAESALETLPDYRDTVFLPQTEFPMRGGLPKLEPELLSQWAEADLYQAVRARRQAAGAETFVLHDGPPYANGHIHIGHALNKLLKDFVVRSQFLLGKDVDFIPGWDCHGLPIEWKIEEQYRAKGRKKDEVPAAEFRKACRDYASGWIDVQREEFKRLGVIGDWANRYATMDFDSEALTVAEFHKFLMSGQLYRGSKPVMWSPVERTALADAEVEYAPHTSPTIWVKFPVENQKPIASKVRSHSAPAPSIIDFNMEGASVVIWTTTPWTIPANRAICFNPKIAYGLYEITEVKTDEELGFAPWVKAGEKLILADKLAESVLTAANAVSWNRLEDASLEGHVCSHPLGSLAPSPDPEKGYGFEVPLLPGDHVTDDAGTGFVHTAPGHGIDDYTVWLKSGRSLDSIPDTVDPDGAYYPHVPLFGGLKVMETEGKKAGKFGDANKVVMDKLIEAGNLLARGRVEHSYPHSWRSKAPVIFRNTAQWFIRMDGDNQLRQKAIKAIADTTFYPDQGRNRIGGMLESRPDWLISRQRNWGTPLAMYVDKATGEPVKDEAVNARIVAAIREGGADAWFTRPDSDFLGDRDPAQFEKITDILDVWFDSGCTHAFTLKRPDKDYPVADLYLEGSDQHRGWFQSSLLESCGTRGVAPYKAVVTHGFTLDENGEKMSKSKGNGIEPQDIIKESGAEILRLWVALTDYQDDQRIGKQILQTTIDAYRKLRNTLRYLLGALHGFEESERVDYCDMPPLERFILHGVWDLDHKVRDAYVHFNYAGVIRPVADFAAQTLSALYFDIRKDSLYCDSPASLKRRACRTVLDILFERLTLWLQPILAFTVEEAWGYRHPDASQALFRSLEPVPAEWENPREAERWQRIFVSVLNANMALEEARNEKTIGSALQADLLVRDHVETMAAFEGLDSAEIFRVSAVTLTSHGIKDGSDTGNMSPIVRIATGHKCERCWRILPEVKADTRLCLRCEAVVAEIGAAHV